PRVHREVLHGRDRLQVLGIVALHPADELHGEAAGEERVLAVRLLATAPPRIAEEIYVRRPEGEPLIALARTLAQVLVVLGSSLIRDDGRCPAAERIVPRGGQPDG